MDRRKKSPFKKFLIMILLVFSAIAICRIITEHGILSNLNIKGFAAYVQESLENAKQFWNHGDKIAELAGEVLSPEEKASTPVSEKAEEDTALTTDTIDQDVESSSERIVQEETGVAYYCYSLLEEDEKECYMDLYQGLLDMEDSIAISTGDQDMIGTVFEAVLYDHPELFWVEYGYTGTVFFNYALLMPEYNCSNEEKENRQAEVDRAMDGALAAIGNPESDYDKVKRVFEYIVDLIEYREDAPDNQNIYSALVNHETVCAGYSRAVQYLLQQMGIETLFVAGTVNGQGAHAWNIVKCDGEYYQVDATFGDRAFGYSDTPNLPEELHYDYAYLCTNDSVIYRDRSVDENCPVPSCTSNSLNYYQINGIYYDQYQRYDSQIRYDMEDNITSGLRYWRCQFSNDEAYEAMMKEVNDDSWYAKMIRDYGSIREGTITTWSIHDDITRVICLWY